MEGHKILSTLCSDEFDELKSKGIGNTQSFTDTSRYALEHGVQHMLLVHQVMKSCSLEQGVGKYVSDAELLYAKLFVNTSGATDDIVGVLKQRDLKTIPNEFHETLSSLLILLKKHRMTLQEYPFTIFQSLLNEGSSKLSSESRQLLETKHSGNPYLEFVNKKDSQTAIQARFVCGSQVVCLDVSRSLEYMVCECRDGSIQFWSLASGNLKWKRNVKPKQYGGQSDGPFRIIVSSYRSVFGFYRCVVFHPIKDIILPGVLNTAFSFDGDSKPFFPTSKCSFSICSIFGQEMLTDCPDDAKCLMIWNLSDGREIDRLNRDKEILSFAMSQDGKLVAISHSTGSVCLLDRENGFSTLAEVTSGRFGLIRFSPDSRFLLCSDELICSVKKVFRLSMTEEPEHYYLTDVAIIPWSSYLELESHRIGGFLLGDPLSLRRSCHYSDVVLNSESLLRNHTHEGFIELVSRNEPTENAEFEHVRFLRFSFTGEIVYAAVCLRSNSQRIMAWGVVNGKLKGQKEIEGDRTICELVPLKEGILFATESTLELWNFDLSVCVRQWSFGACAVFPVSDDQVACLTFETREWIIWDTVSGVTVATLELPRGTLIACYRDLQLFASPRFEWPEFIEMRQLGKTEPLWRVLQSAPLSCLTGFSPKGHFIVFSQRDGDAYVLDAVSGKCNVRLEFSGVTICDCKFISEEECIFLTSIYPTGRRLEVFNVRSGVLLSAMHVEWGVYYNQTFPLATCPRMGLIAICSSLPSDLKIIKVKHPGEKTLSRETKRFKLQE
ncbi:uncharacterized protein [Montipora capricornis]|uniref:uncharacterized protein n=1 Tax=Montipora capricornis TaxID=246305 RepID=UPI0035F1AE23